MATYLSLLVVCEHMVKFGLPFFQLESDRTAER